MPKKKKRSAGAGATAEEEIPIMPRDPSEDMTVQSGDLQGLTDLAESDSQSVRELVEEGQFFEAEVLAGVENTPPVDKRHRKKLQEFPEDDVPSEYTDQPEDEPRE